jgi:predicted glutamine amidotransferase
MCRLLGVVAATSAPIDELVPAELPRLERLAEVHPHGWGVAHVTTGRALDLERVPERAGSSEAWRRVVTEAPTDAALLHIRQASPGMPHITRNTHPFVGDDMAFAHNGHAHPSATLDGLIADAGAPAPEGDTDSERYFSLLRAAATDPDTLDAALLDTAQRIASVATATSLNALVLTPDALIAIAWWHEPVIRDAGDGETDRDYRLWYRVADDRVVVASAFVRDDDPAWRELPHGHALHVERGTLRTRVTAVEDIRAAA